MSIILQIILVYIGYLILWGVICLVAFSLAIVFKKNSIMAVIAGLQQLVIYILNFAIEIGLLGYLAWLFFQGKIFLLTIMIMVGIGILKLFLTFLQMPFLIIPSYFIDKIEEFNKEPDIIKGEILDENNKVIGVTEEGEKEVNRRLATYFIAVYGLNLLSIFIDKRNYPIYYKTYTWGDFITMPFLWIVYEIIFFGLIFGVYNLITKGKFFYPRKKIFLITTLKIATIVVVICYLFLLLVGMWRI